MEPHTKKETHSNCVYLKSLLISLIAKKYVCSFTEIEEVEIEWYLKHPPCQNRKDNTSHTNEQPR